MIQWQRWNFSLYSSASFGQPRCINSNICYQFFIACLVCYLLEGRPKKKLLYPLRNSVEETVITVFFMILVYKHIFIYSTKGNDQLSLFGSIENKNKLHRIMPILYLRLLKLFSAITWNKEDIISKENRYFRVPDVSQPCKNQQRWLRKLERVQNHKLATQIASLTNN